MAEQKITNPHILIAGQHRASLQLENVNLEHWISNQISALRNVTDRPIIVRPHPRCQLRMQELPTDVQFEQPHKLQQTYDSFDMHWDVDTVINYNSGPGIQAVIAGVPVIVDSTSLAYNVVDREQWLIEICHTEYTVEEIEQGLWVKKIGLEN